MLKGIVKTAFFCIILITAIPFSNATNRIYKLSAEGKTLEVLIVDQEVDHEYYDRVFRFVTTPKDVSSIDENYGHGDEYENNSSPLRTLTTRHIHRRYTHTKKHTNAVEVKSAGEKPDINYNWEPYSFPLLDSALLKSTFHRGGDFSESVMLPIGAICTGDYIFEPILAVPEVQSLTDNSARLIGSLRYGLNSNAQFSGLMYVYVDIEIMEGGSIRVNRIFSPEERYQVREIGFFNLSFIHNEGENDSELSSDHISSDNEDDDKLSEATGTHSTTYNFRNLPSRQPDINPTSHHSLFFNDKQP